MARDFNIDVAERNQRQRRPELFEGVATTLGGLDKVASIGSRIRAYLQRAMEAVSSAYLDSTFASCNKVQQRLSELLLSNLYTVEFERQGSATNGTIIRRHSDVDLLAISRHVRVVDDLPASQATFKGNVVDDLLKLRAVIARLLKAEFADAVVDPDPMSKAVTLVGGSLACKVDVVPAVWHDNLEYQRTRRPVDRGIWIVDPRTRAPLTNRPFLHNDLIERKDAHTHANYRPLVRLLKNVVADTELEDVSSYAVVALVYQIPDAELGSVTRDPVKLISIFLAFAARLARDSALRAKLTVPVGAPPLFATDNRSGVLTLAAFNDLTRRAQQTKVAAENAS